MYNFILIMFHLSIILQARVTPYVIKPVADGPDSQPSSDSTKFTPLSDTTQAAAAASQDDTTPTLQRDGGVTQSTETSKGPSESTDKVSCNGGNIKTETPTSASATPVKKKRKSYVGFILGVY